ncbi:hypothetical protein HN51_002618 [Arachis hypogaea]|uniref:exopolygalacturonase-like n=1 Tax=Arachis hypogaea TaxID=3818 RepID=UPI000DEC075F|nr:exopolygalacturonase-like [Arachis hypogaea]QHO50833.1 Exopolygalacturonase clone [Arachis hypogaea]
MIITKRATIYTLVLIITLFASSCYEANAGPIKTRSKPIGGPDIHAGQDVERDHHVLLPGEKIHNVMDFGAVPDGETDSTQAFMDAWAATRESTVKSRFLVPPGRFLIGEMFLNGPCKFNGPIVMQIDGTVLASTDISEYMNEHWLRIEDHFDLKITGVGTFDGQGHSSWKIVEDCDKKTQGSCVKNPANLYFSNVTNGIVHGVKSVNPKGSHIFVTSSANFRITNVQITAPENSPNTDGIHISHSDNVIVSKTFIGTGDDCIGMIQGSSNIVVEDVTCGPGHGISIGSLGKEEGEAEVKGVHVRNSRLVRTTNGLRIKAWPGHKFPGAASDVFFSNITMEDVRNAIIIDQEYLCPKDCTKQPSLVKIKNVHFIDIRGTTTSATPVNMKCSKLNPCEGIIFRDINFQFGNTLKKLTIPQLNSSCINVKPIFEGIQIPPPCLDLPLMPKLPTAPVTLPVLVPTKPNLPPVPVKLPALKKSTLPKAGTTLKMVKTSVTTKLRAPKKPTPQVPTKSKLPPVHVALKKAPKKLKLQNSRVKKGAPKAKNMRNIRKKRQH